MRAATDERVRAATDGRARVARGDRHRALVPPIRLGTGAAGSLGLTDTHPTWGGFAPGEDARTSRGAAVIRAQHAPSLSIFDRPRDALDEIFLVDGSDEIRLGELTTLVARAAGGLVRRGLVDAGLLALRGTNRRETLVAILACFALGVPFVPVHPRATTEETARLVTLSGAATLLGDDELARLGEHAPSPIRRGLDPEAPAVVLYTSGTTGVPKGAELPARALVASAHASAKNLPLRADDAWLLALPICHIGGLSILARCLLARRPLVLLPRFDVGEVARRLERVTIASFVPTMLHDLLEHRGAPGALRAALVGGAPASERLLEAAARARFPALTTYGLTEACSQVSSQAPRDPSSVERGVGTPLPGTAVSLVGRDGAPTPRGEIGEIVVDGPTMMLGYRGGARRTGPFATGDLGAWDEAGRLHVVGRRSEVVVTGGENVYPLEVEAVLTRIPGVRAACVVGIPDARWGELVGAAVVLDAPVSLGDVEDAARARLASFRLPRRWRQLDALPIAPSGKLDRRAVARAVAARGSDEA